MSSRRSLQAEEIWNSLHHSEISDEAVNDYSDMSTDEHLEEEDEALLTVSDVHRTLHPLQSAADRVGKQVEQFAETLDRLYAGNQSRQHTDCRYVLPLVESYRNIASDTVKRLKKFHAPERDQRLSSSWKRRLRSSSGRSTPTLAHPEDEEELRMNTTVEDLQRWEQEEQTWDLLGVMLQLEYPVQQDNVQDPKLNQGSLRPSRNIGVHRYSSERKVWNRFLAEDDLAWERHSVVEWLKRSAESSGQDIDSVVKQLDSGADRGSGLWAHGWLYSKEAIKGQKRLRSWPQALDPNSPGIDTSLLNSDKTQGLVTQLDPDAITRQGRDLEKQDLYFERATWLACWEMIRRGKSWSTIREWCQERVEGWRATTMRGDPRISQSNEEALDSEESLATGWQSRTLWRRVCTLAARNGGIDKYENAVYGALSGHLPSVETVSSSWDDYLFAHYNSYLLRQFDRYLQADFPDRLPSASLQRHGSNDLSMDVGSRTLSGNQIVEKMKTLEATKEEARQPIKMLQGSLIAKTFGDFVFKHGIVLARSANVFGRSKILPDMNPSVLEGSVTAELSMKDHDLLRIITHILFIYQDLGLSIGEGDHQFAVESIVVAYVDYLGKAGKQQLLPLYASRLSSQRSTMCLARQLPSITDYRERQIVTRLMKQAGLDVSGVLNTQLRMIIQDTPPNFDNSAKYPKLDILELGNKDVREIRHIRTGFLGQSITSDEEDLINGFEWYMLLDGHWQQTMTTGAILYKHLLRSRGISAARKLSKTVTFSNLSLSKTKALLGKMVDISRSQEASEDESSFTSVSQTTRSHRTASQRHRRSSSAIHARNGREILFDQSRTFRDLEALFVVLDAMEYWKEISEQAISQFDSGQAREWKLKLQKAHDSVELAMEPLLHSWMQYPQDDVEAAEVKEIRAACIPEVVLAYISVLNVEGRGLSRELLLKCMDLASVIAAEDSDLAECFVAAGRMPELVDCLAISSKSILRAEEVGVKKSKSRKKWDGQSLDVWTVKSALT